MMKNPFNPLEIIFLVMAAMPGAMTFMHGPASNPAQRVFRIGVTLVGILGFAITRIVRSTKNDTQ